ncbi:MAG: thiopurine S-methyltransferase [Deltaproteobacteria bacterium]|nr:thiopurine S-methyltransferase [Deltaproteobacteria bacterium]
MEPDFWLSRWQEGKTGFHGAAVHEDLVTHQERFLGGGPHRVLVPLCGKTLDLDWLGSLGHEVLGVELSSLAVDEVMARSDQPVTRDSLGPYQRSRTGNVTLLCGDIFEATPELLGSVDRIWDRAAMVALPPTMRPRYASTLRALLAPGGMLLQNSFGYDQSKMDGPPFAVLRDEVAEHYGDWGTELLDTRVLTEGKFAERGISAFEISLTLVTKPA